MLTKLISQEEVIQLLNLRKYDDLISFETQLDIIKNNPEEAVIYLLNHVSYEHLRKMFIINDYYRMLNLSEKINLNINLFDYEINKINSIIRHIYYGKNKKQKKKRFSLNIMINSSFHCKIDFNFENHSISYDNYQPIIYLSIRCVRISNTIISRNINSHFTERYLNNKYSIIQQGAKILLKKCIESAIKEFFEQLYDIIYTELNDILFNLLKSQTNYDGR